MSEQDKKRLENICDSLKKASPTQQEFILGFAEGLAYASETRTPNENDNQNQEG